MFNPMQLGSKGAAIAKLAILQKRISGKKITIEKDGVEVTVTGDGKLKEVRIDGNDDERVVRAANEAITQAQKYAAGEMQGSMGDLSKIFGQQ